MIFLVACVWKANSAWYYVYSQTFWILFWHMVKWHSSASFEIILGYKLITGNGSCSPVAHINSQQFMQEPGTIYSTFFMPSIAKPLQMVTLPSAWTQEWGQCSAKTPANLCGHVVWVRNELLFLSVTEIWGCLLSQHNKLCPDWYSWKVCPQGFTVLVSDFIYMLKYYKDILKTAFTLDWINHISQFMTLSLLVCIGLLS